jgi:CheY-like chemotaxis protein
MNARILLVDDEPLNRKTLDLLLRFGGGHQVETADNAEQALARLAEKDKEPVDLLLTDHYMPGMMGAELARLVRERFPGLPIILYSGHPLGDFPWVDKVLRKPEDIPILLATISQLLEAKGRRPAG